MKNFEGEVERIKELYNAAWEKNWGFVPMTDHEIDHLAEQFKPVVIPELVPFAEKDGKVIGFGIALPDLNVVFRRNRSGRHVPADPPAPLGAQDPEDPPRPHPAPRRPARVPRQGRRRDAVSLDLDQVAASAGSTGARRAGSWRTIPP